VSDKLTWRAPRPTPYLLLILTLVVLRMGRYGSRRRNQGTPWPSRTATGRAARVGRRWCVTSRAEDLKLRGSRSPLVLLIESYHNRVPPCSWLPLARGDR